MNNQRPRAAVTRLGGVRVVRFTLALVVPGALFSPFAHGADLLQMYKAAHDHDAKFQGSTYQRDAMEKLRLRTISSPIDAVVVDRKQSPGDYVGETPILTLADINPLHVEVIVPVERLGTIRKGMRAEVYPAAPVGGKYEAKVAIVDQVIDAASGTFGVRLILPNPKHKLPAGLKCKVEFPAH